MPGLMPNYKLMLALACLTACTVCGCGTARTDAAGTVHRAPDKYRSTCDNYILGSDIVPLRIVSQPATQLPRAVIYKTNVDVNNHVPVMLTADGSAFLSFPAPSDLNALQMPLPLTNGWLLDRRGAIGPNTAFLTYTYSQYESLPQSPSPAQLRDSIMPGAHVTEAYRLPISINQARNDTAAVDSIIRNGLKGAVPLVFSAKSR